MKYLILYHGGNCTDGQLSAFLFWKAFKKNIPDYETACEFVEVQYGDIPPDATGKHVYILDFSYSPEKIKEYFSTAESIRILDHHLSAYQEHLLYAIAVKNEAPLDEEQVAKAIEEYPFTGYKRFSHAGTCCNNGHAYAAFAKERSGCGMAMDYLDRAAEIATILAETDREDQRLLHWVERIEDRDLWKFKYEDTKVIYELLNSVPKTFKGWDALLNLDTHTYSMLLERASARVTMRTELAQSLAKHAEPVLLFDKLGVAVNTPSFLASEVGAILSETHDYAIMYVVNSESTILSFRSKEGVGANVSEICKKLGGGGHRNAAGVKIDTAIFNNRLSIWARAAKMKLGN